MIVEVHPIDWNIIIPSLMVGIPAIISACLGFMNRLNINETKTQVKETNRMVNGRTDQLINSIKEHADLKIEVAKAEAAIEKKEAVSQAITDTKLETNNVPIPKLDSEPKSESHH